MVVHTKSAGRTSIKVMVRCLNASAGQFEGNVTELSDEVQILVSVAGAACCRSRCILRGRNLWAVCMNRCINKRFLWGVHIGRSCTERFTPPFVCFFLMTNNGFPSLLTSSCH